MPKNWEWARLGEITNYGNTKNVEVESIDKDSWILELEDIEKDSGNLITKKLRRERDIKGVRHKFYKGEILYSKLRTYLNKILIAPEDGYCTTEIMAINSYGILSNEYLSIVLKSPYFINYTNSCVYGVKMPRISTNDACKGLIPLPPYLEQIKIVEEIKRYNKFIDILERNKEECKIIIKRLKLKILDLAIHGKLVPQNPNDTPASEILKCVNTNAEAICDNKHYNNIPAEWCISRIGDVFEITMGQSPTGSSINEKDGLEFHQGKLNFTDKYLSISKYYTNAPIKIADPNTILICVRAPVGIVNINLRRICIGRGLCCLKPKKAIYLDFAFYLLVTYKEKFERLSTGSTFKSISKNIIKNEILFVPPIEEQKRIVKRIEKIFSSLNLILYSLEV